MKAIFKKDLNSLFNSFIGWLFLAVTWAFISLYVWIICFVGLSGSMSNAVAYSIMILMIMIPVICMRSFEEERKQKTDQLLLTSPVSIGKIVAGKFLAIAAVWTILCGASCVYPIILLKLGGGSLASNFAAIFGLWLLGLAEISICVFISSLTESMIIAAVISVGILFLTYLIPRISSAISSSGNAFTKVLDVFALQSHFYNFLSGAIDLTSVVYFASITVLFLFFTAQVLQKRRYTVSRKTIGFGAYSVATIAVITAIVVVANFAFNKLPASATTIDVTTGKLYSLTDETKDYLSGLDEDVTIYVLENKSDADEVLNKTLENMGFVSDHIKVEWVDPAKNPDFLSGYNVSSTVYTNSLLVVGQNRWKIVGIEDIYQYEVTDYTTYETQITGYDGEGRIVSALQYVTSDNVNKAYVLTGHGEVSLGTDFTSALDKMNFESADLDLMQNDAIPDDCGVLIINAPQNDLSSDDADKIIEYLNGGGSIIISTNFTLKDSPNMDRVLAFYSLTAEDGIVIESDSDKYYRNEAYLLPTVGYDEMTSSIVSGSGNGYVFSPYSQALTKGSAEGTEYTDLLTTSEGAFIRSDFDENTTDFSKRDSDVSGQFTVGVKAVKQTENGESVCAAFGSAVIFTDNVDMMVAGSNSSLFSSAVSSLVKTDEGIDLISIPTKEYSTPTITVSTAYARFDFILMVIAVPVILIVVGLAVWLSRRKR